MPNGNSIIKDYEVSINGEKKRTNETEFLVLLTGLGNIITITITAIDNAERRGKEFTQLYDPSGKYMHIPARLHLGLLSAKIDLTAQ